MKNKAYETPAADGSEVFSPAGNDIVFNNVNFAYDNKEVLKNVSFSAKEGEVTALVGPSGSGKSKRKSPAVMMQLKLIS